MMIMIRILFYFILLFECLVEGVPPLPDRMARQRGTLFHIEGLLLPPTRMARRRRDALSRVARQRGTLSLVEGMQHPPAKKTRRRVRIKTI